MIATLVGKVVERWLPLGMRFPETADLACEKFRDRISSSFSVCTSKDDGSPTHYSLRPSGDLPGSPPPDPLPCPTCSRRVLPPNEAKLALDSLPAICQGLGMIGVCELEDSCNHVCFSMLSCTRSFPTLPRSIS